MTGFGTLEVAPRNAGHLLVFRDSTVPIGSTKTPVELGLLLQQWLDWIDQLKTRGILRHCSALDWLGGTVRRRVNGSSFGTLSPHAETVIGYLVIDTQCLSDAAEIARSCPGLEHGFEIDVFCCYDPLR